MTDLIIRPATSADLQALHALAAQTFPLACPPGTSEANIQAFIAKNLSADAFRGYLSSESHAVWLATDGFEPVGYAMAVTGEPKDSGIAAMVTKRPTVELSKIYVTVEAQGSGVSTALLHEVEAFAASLGAKSVWLGVNQFNDRANRFYERQRFAVVGTREFQVGDSVESDFVREKTLT